MDLELRLIVKLLFSKSRMNFYAYKPSQLRGPESAELTHQLIHLQLETLKLEKLDLGIVLSNKSMTTLGFFFTVSDLVFTSHNDVFRFWHHATLLGH